MEQLTPLIDTNDLRSGLMRDAMRQDEPPHRVVFDSDCDSLTLLWVSNDLPKVTHFLDDNVALLFEPESLMVVGYYIEGVLHNLVEKHPDKEALQELANMAREMAEYGDMVIISEQPRPSVSEPVNRAVREFAYGLPPETGPLTPLVPA